LCDRRRRASVGHRKRAGRLIVGLWKPLFQDCKSHKHCNKAVSLLSKAVLI
jgi:hypothetical protein